MGFCKMAVSLAQGIYASGASRKPHSDTAKRTSTTRRRASRNMYISQYHGHRKVYSCYKIC